MGRVGLGETIWYQERKRRERENFLASLTASAAPSDIEHDVNGTHQASTTESEVAFVGQKGAPESLNDLLPPDQVTMLKSALGSLELEQAVQELLMRNAKALQRLEELQLERLGEEGGGSRAVEVDSEEWEVGTLTTLLCLQTDLQSSKLKVY